MASKQSKKSIYGIADPRTGEIRYVGASAIPFFRRLMQHWLSCRRHAPEMHAWLTEIINADKIPVMVTLVKDPANWEAAEQKCIAEIGASGMRLFNKSIGGAGSNGVHHNRPRPDMRKPNIRDQKLTAVQIIAIRTRIKNGEKSRHLAKEYGVSEALVSYVKHGKKRHLYLSQELEMMHPEGSSSLEGMN